LSQIPDNSVLIIDQSNCVYVNHDVAEIISDFVRTASSRGVTVEFIERRKVDQIHQPRMMAAA
jgi:MFS superfamily sulfate permease-like transporter